MVLFTVQNLVIKSWVFCRDIGTVVVGNSGNVILDGFLL
jgi:hypothetical protein